MKIFMLVVSLPLSKKLGLNKPIICGASMAGQVCLAVAIRYREVGAGGAIPLQGSDYLNMVSSIGFNVLGHL